MRVYAALLVLVALAEVCTVTWCTLWPLLPNLGLLGNLHGWEQLYGVATSNLDVWLLCLARQLVVAGLVAGVHPYEACQRNPRAMGAPLTPNHQQLALGVSLTSRLAETLLLFKAIAVAVGAPDAVLPPPEVPGAVGLLAMYGSILTSFLGTTLTSMLAYWLVEARGTAPPAPASKGGSSGDEEQGVTRPLLGRASWEAPAAGGSKAAAGAAGGSRGGAEGKEGEAAGGQVNQATILELLRLSLPDWPLILTAFGAGAVAALMAALIPFYTGLIIDAASIDPDRDAFMRTTGLLLVVAAACGVFTGVRGGLFSVAMTRLNVRLRTALFASLLRQEIGFYDTVKTGDLTSRLSVDTHTVSDQVCLNLNVFLRNATQAGMVLSFMFAASWRLTVVTFILIPVVLLISKVYGAYFRKLSKKVQAELAEANAVAQEVMGNITTVKSHAAAQSAQVAYAAKLGDYYALQLKESAAYSAYAAATTFLPSTVAAAVLFYGGHLVLAGQMSPGALVSFMLYQQSLSNAFQYMGDVFSALTAAVGAADKVIELLKRPPGVPAQGGYIPPSCVLEGRVEMREVVFSYPARPAVRVLNGLSLTIHPGEVVALVGPSGGGKSSIIKLLQRFYLPQSGAVLLDGRDVGDYQAGWLARHMALVSQEPVLFARSLRRNILYGLEPEDGVTDTPTQADVEEAARQANAADFIAAFPNGYETEAGEKGLALSGGQKQRIAIARALVRRPQVLLLDEATSALDADSEAVVQEALQRLMVGRTVCVIAHRLSTIQDANRIIVINQGRVAETGTHDELLQQRGSYAQLVARQVQRSPSTIALGQAGIGDSRDGSSCSRAGGGSHLGSDYGDALGDAAFSRGGLDGRVASEGSLASGASAAAQLAAAGEGEGRHHPELPSGPPGGGGSDAGSQPGPGSPLARDMWRGPS